MAKFLADENIARKLVVALKKAGAEVTWVPNTKYRSASDKTLIGIANANGMFILTKDRDFIEPGNRRIITTGVVYLAMDMPEDSIAELAGAIAVHAKSLQGKVVIMASQHTLIEELHFPNL